MLLEFATQSILFTVTQILVMVAVYPLAAIPLSVLLILFYLVNKYSHIGILEARKLDNITKSQVLNNLTAVLSGIPVIRGYEREIIFQRR